MKKIIPIIIGVVALLTGGSYLALNIGDQIEVANIQQTDFSFNVEQTNDQIQIQIQDLQMSTTTDDSGKVVNVGVKIPIKYNFPKLIDGAYKVVEVEEYVEMNFGAYNMCRSLGNSVEKCGQELKDDMRSNVITRQKNIQRELEELKAKVFESEIIL